MQTRFITTEEELVAIKEDWDRLVAGRPETDRPFYSWDWFYRSWIHFGKSTGQGLFIVAVSEGERLVGILPLVRDWKKSSGISYRILCFCNIGITPRNTMYTDSARDQEAVFRAAWNHLFEHRPDWDMLEFAKIPDSNPFHRFLLEGEHHGGYTLIQNQSAITPFIELTGTLDEYIDSLSKETRKHIRKRVRRFNAAGSSRLVRFFEKPDEIDEGLEYLETVHNNSWKGPYRNQHYPLFYQEVTPILARNGGVLIAIAFLDDVPISGYYSLRKNDTYYGCIADYDQKYSEYSPGIVLLNYQWEYLLKEGGKIFDFCGTTYAYKEKYATGHQNHSTFQIFHSGWKSRFIYSVKTFWLPLLRRIMRKPADKDFILKKKQ